MPDYRKAMSRLASEYEQWTDIPASKLIAPAMQWYEQQGEDGYQSLTEARSPTFLKIFKHHIPRAGYELANMRGDGHHTFGDAAADLAISISLAIVEYAMGDLLDAFDDAKSAYEPRNAYGRVIDPDYELERARDARERTA